MLKTRPNVLFVSPQRLDSNTGYHIQWYARQLSLQGARCAIAVPETTGSDETFDKVTVIAYETALDSDLSELFRNGRSVEVLYAWTPRESVRRFSQRVREIIPCPLIIHFEDNEEYLTESATGLSLSALIALPVNVLDTRVAADRYHPVRGKEFIEQADGMSYLIKSLSRFNSSKVPHQVLAAPVDESLFNERSVNRAYREKLGISDDECVLVYPGNVHDANLNEISDLYEAVRLLNDGGLPTTLIRTGVNDDGAREVLRGYAKVIDLGWVDRKKIADVMACADIFVQPGSPGPFNDERVPSKLPEFFAIGRPVLLSRSNLGLIAKDGKEAVILDDVSPGGIASEVDRVFKDKPLFEQLTLGSRDFYRSTLKANVDPMVILINNLLRKKQKIVSSVTNH